MVLGKLDSYMQENETGPFLYNIHKNKFKIDQRPKYETWNPKTPEENRASNHLENNLSNILADMPPKATATKANINYWDCTKLKCFCAEKETTKKTTKRQPTEWEKIFANDISNKGVISKLYKELIYPKPPPNNPI